jgi:hypothetical protein
MAIVAKWLTHRIVVPTFVGSIPISRPIYIIYLSGCSLVVKPQPSKLMLSVRFRSPAPLLFHSSSVVELSAVNRSVVGSSPTCGAIRPLGQAVKTPPFHGGNTGSNPVGVI